MKLTVNACLLMLLACLGGQSGSALAQAPKPKSAPTPKASSVTKGGNSGLIWEKSFADGLTCATRAVVVLRDGSIATAGQGMDKNDETHLMVRRLDRDGNQLWSKELTTPSMRMKSDNKLYSLAVTTEGDLLAAGFYSREWATSDYPGSRLPKYVMETIGLLARVSPEGKLLWQRDITTPNPDVEFLKGTGHEREYGLLHAVIALPEGIAAFGQGFEKPAGPSFFCARLRSDGTEISRHFGEYSAQMDESPTRALALPDGSSVAAYTASGTKAGEYMRAAMVRFDAAGRRVWLQSYPVNGYSIDLTGLIVDANGNFFLAGIASEAQSQSKDVWLARIAADGRLDWQKVVKDTEGFMVQIRAIAALKNGDIAAVGMEGTPIRGTSRGMVMRIAADGTLLWKKTIAGFGSARAVTEAPDGNWIVGGEVWPQGMSGNRLAWVFKIAPGGR
jgi:hypothetical protein